MPMKRPNVQVTRPVSAVVETKQRILNRDPMPKTLTQADMNGAIFQPNTTGRVSYQNKTNESSEVHRIIIVASPLVQVSVKKTINNQEIEIMPSTRLSDLGTPEVGGTGKVIDFRRIANKPLTVGRSEYIHIDCVHTYNANQMITILLEKDQILWVDENVMMRR